MLLLLHSTSHSSRYMAVSTQDLSKQQICHYHYAGPHKVTNMFLSLQRTSHSDKYVAVITAQEITYLCPTYLVNFQPHVSRLQSYDPPQALAYNHTSDAHKFYRIQLTFSYRTRISNSAVKLPGQGGVVLTYAPDFPEETTSL